MNIVQVNTWDVDGGAARAVYRLHKGLLQQGHSETLVCLSKSSDDPAVLEVAVEAIAHQPNALSTHIIQTHAIDGERTSLSNTLFSFPYPGWDINGLPVIQAADVINLHWVARFQSLTTLKKLLALSKPVVWTLHDMWAFTGGCHYSAGCLKYEADCMECPQLAHESSSLAAAVLRDKLEIFAEANLTIVTPSQWLADCARKSQLFQNLRIEVIPNSLETDVFFPVDKAVAKQQFGIASETTTLLFGAFTAEEKRKGFTELLKATQQCLENSDFRTLVEQNRLLLLCFGQPDPSLEALPIPVHSFGKIASDTMLRDIYSAADVFVLPSMQDNLPNTMLEAMSCGTPVLAFDVGGIPDVVIPEKTGWLVPERDVAQLAEAMLKIALNLEKPQLMGNSCRCFIEEKFPLSVQASRYLALYQSLLDNKPIQVAPVSQSPAQFATAPLDTSTGMHTQSVIDAIARPLLESQVQQVLAEKALIQAQLQQQKEALQQQQEIAQQQQNEALQQQELLQQLYEYLDRLKSHAKTQDVTILHLRSQLEKQQSKVNQQKSRIEQYEADKKSLGDRIGQLEVQLRVLQRQITAIESSKFWKLRTAWISLKERLRLKR
ncbi:glycosyltransferase family 4 protein [Thermoleptolyngbya sp.]